jgi:hypothetical protein
MWQGSLTANQGSGIDPQADLPTASQVQELHPASTATPAGGSSPLQLRVTSIVVCPSAFAASPLRHGTSLAPRGTGGQDQP